MALSPKIPAADWTFEIDDGTDTDTFVEIKGLESFSIEPSSNRADTTNFDSGGDEDGYVATRGKGFNFDGDYLLDVADGTRDPGQERVEEAGELTGSDSCVPFKITDPAGNTFTQDVTVDNAGPTGGGTQDNTAWSAALTRAGSTTTA